ncbi:MAG: gamma-glutamylcyclotransferase [Gammaproteobacteria bacterium]|nr:MAG: gamma-glutamylcyclotransferase [Gammaproteobacteria bacterium]
MPMERLFVYGTLMRRGSMHRLLDGEADLLGRGWVRGRLYRVADYPGLVAGGGPADRVWGELYRLRGPGRVLARIDAYEGCASSEPRPHEYRRQRLSVHLEDGRIVPAWGYVYLRPVHALQRIPAGRYPPRDPGVEA